MANFNNQVSETIFVDYFDIIRSPWVKIRNYLVTNESTLKPFINYDLLPDSDEKMEAWSLLRKNFNGLFDFGTGNFFYDAMLQAMEDEIPDLWDSEKFLIIGNVLDMIASQKMIKQIYVYSHMYDVRIDNDLSINYKNMVKYIYGEFNDVVKECKPTTFILNNIEKFNALLTDNCDSVSGKTVLITKHLYNFRMGENGMEPDLIEGYDLDKISKIHINFGMFNSAEVSNTILYEMGLEDNAEIEFYNYDMDDTLAHINYDENVRKVVEKARKEQILQNHTVNKNEQTLQSYGADEEEDVSSEIVYMRYGSNNDDTKEDAEVSE